MGCYEKQMFSNIWMPAPFSSLFIGIWAATPDEILTKTSLRGTFSSLFIGIWAATEVENDCKYCDGTLSVPSS